MVRSDSSTKRERGFRYLFRVQAGHLVVAFLREDDGEHGVRAAARLVHIGGGHRPAERDTRVTCVEHAGVTHNDEGHRNLKSRCGFLPS